MRLIAGSLGGRHFAAPKGHRTHPMSEKARGGLFNILGDISGLTVLDAFSGSGAMGFEAISRGAKTALLIENDRAAVATIQANIQSLNLTERCRVTGMGVSSWAKDQDGLFDIIIADPPYDKLQIGAITELGAHLTRDGIMVVSLPSSLASPEIVDMEKVEEKVYGDATLVFYRKIA